MSKLACLLAASTMLCSVSSIAHAQTTAPDVQPNGNGVPVINTQPGGVYFRVPLENETAPVNQPYTWNPANSSCSTQCGAGTKTVGYQCNEVATGSVVANTFCTAALGAVPATQTQSCTVFSGCSYSWITPPPSVVPTAIGSNPVGTTTCGQVQASYQPYCQRSDGTVLSSADNNYCINAPGFPASEQPGSDAFGYNRTEIRTNGCTASDFEWRVTNWSGWSSTCSDAATQTRSVTCVRRFDSSAQPDSFCSAVPKPAASQTQGVYSTCAYGWRTAPSWSNWTSPTGNNPLCSADATRVRAVWCERTNTAAPAAPATTVADSFCSGAGARPASTETGNYAGCTFDWVAGNWSAWNISAPNNGSAATVTATRTRTMTCMRSDGTVAGNASCAGTMPGTSETYTLNTGNWSAWSSSCSNAATRSRSITCQFTSGNPTSTTSAANSACSNVGIVIGGASETSGQYGGCSYNWTAGNWGGWSVTNGGLNASRSRSVSCLRSDGSSVADSFCNAGTRPAANESLAWSVGGWSGWSSQCSTAAIQTRSVACLDGGNAAQADSVCTSAGMPKPGTVNGPTTITSSCGAAIVNPGGTCTNDPASPTGSSRPATCQVSTDNGGSVSVSWTQCQGTTTGRMYTNGRQVCPGTVTFDCYYWWPRTPPLSSHREHWLRWCHEGGSCGSYPTSGQYKICLVSGYSAGRPLTQEEWTAFNLYGGLYSQTPIVQERFGSQRWLYMGQVYNGLKPTCTQNWNNRTGPGVTDNIIGMEKCTAIPQ